MDQMPNFIIIGAPKAGTTSVAHYLQQHPDIYMSPKKEPHFFAFEGEDSLPHFKGPGEYKTWQDMTALNLADYQALFANATTEKARGEASTLYMYYKDSAHRIKKYVPDIKLIAILRNPVDRAFSAYLHRKRQGREPYSLEEAVANESNRMKENWGASSFYIQVGLYYEQLLTFYEYFDKSNLLILFYDDLRSDREAFMQQIYEYLDVELNPEIDVSQQLNVSGSIQNPIVRKIDRVVNHNTKLVKRVTKIVPRSIFEPVQSSYRSIRDRNKVREKITTQQRSFLLPFFLDDIHKLEELLNRDLKRWYEDHDLVELDTTKSES